MSKTAHSNLYYTLIALTAFLLFSTGGLCIKVIPLQAYTVAGVRSTFAVLFFLVLFYQRKTLRSLFQLNWIGWITALSYASVISLFVVANKLTTAANVIFLEYTMVVWVMIGGVIWLNEKLTFGRVFSIATNLFGMLLFFQGKLQFDDWAGNLVALVAGFFFGVMTLGFRAGRDQNPQAAVLIGNGIAAIINLGIVTFFMPQEWVALASMDWLSWTSIIWLGVFQIGVAYVCYTTALKGLPAIEVAILALLVPILNPVWVYFGIGEVPSVWSVIGGIIILISVIIRIFVVTEKNQSFKETKSEEVNTQY